MEEDSAYAGLCLLAHLACEGEAIHPDVIEFGEGADLTDEQYVNQLKAYADWRGVEETIKEMCTRPHLLTKLLPDTAEFMDDKTQTTRGNMSNSPIVSSAD